MDKVVFSVVTAAYNEQEVLPDFFEKIIPICEKLGAPFEVIAVSDGSNDATWKVIGEACLKDKRIKGIELSRNFGQQAALLCGLNESRGDAVIVMDADLQDPPEIIVEMAEKWKQGADVVHAKRRSRPGDGFFKKQTAKIYYKFLKAISRPAVPENVGDFKLYSRRAVDAILNLPERSRYLKAESVWIGFNQAYVEFDRPSREKGETKYSFKKLLRLAFDGVISNSNYPLTISAKAGICILALSAACFLAFIVLAACGIGLPLAAWLFPAIAAALGTDLAIKGFSDIYIAKIYEEVKFRPVYLVKEKLNADDKEMD